MWLGKKKKRSFPQYQGPALSLDYKLGGGFKFKHAYEIFGPEHVGKTSAFAYSIIRNFQKMDLGIATLIAAEARNVEPAGLAWMRRFGVEPENMDIKLPDHIEHGMSMLKEAVKREFGLIVIDSLGAMGTESESNQDDLKAKAYGISGSLLLA